MKNYQDILNAQKKFYSRKQQYFNLNCEFYLNLINQISAKGEIPKGGLLKYKCGTNDNSNIVEDWIMLNNDGSCSMQISIIVNNILHDVDLLTNKQNNLLTLTIKIYTENQEFNFDLSKTDVNTINFDNVIEYIFEILANNYDDSIF